MCRQEAEEAERLRRAKLERLRQEELRRLEVRLQALQRCLLVLPYACVSSQSGYEVGVAGGAACTPGGQAAECLAALLLGSLADGIAQARRPAAVAAGAW